MKKVYDKFVNLPLNKREEIVFMIWVYGGSGIVLLHDKSPIVEKISKTYNLAPTEILQVAKCVVYKYDGEGVDIRNGRIENNSTINRLKNNSIYGLNGYEVTQILSAIPEVRKIKKNNIDSAKNEDDKIAEDIINSKLTYKEIAEKYKVSLTRVNFIAKNRNIGRRTKSEEKPIEPIEEQKEKEVVEEVDEEEDYEYLYTPKKRQGSKKKEKRAKIRYSKQIKKQSKNNHQIYKDIKNNNDEYLSHIDINLVSDSVEKIADNIENHFSNKLELKVEENKEEMKEEKDIKELEFLGTTYPGIVELQRPKDIVEVALISDRHDMYVTSGIFEKGLDNSLMINYEKQYEMCNKWINRNIKFENGIAKQNIILYCTGLQCALASVIKCCYERKVNLILKHYNPETNKYTSQIMWDQFGKIADIVFPFEKLLNKGTIYTYNISIEEISNTSKLHVISINKHKTNVNSSFEECFYIIVKDFNAIWEIYPKFVAAIQDNLSEYYSIFATTASIRSTGFVWDDNIAKSYNFK